MMIDAELLEKVSKKQVVTGPLPDDAPLPSNEVTAENMKRSLGVDADSVTPWVNELVEELVEVEIGSEEHESAATVFYLGLLYGIEAAKLDAD